MTFPRHIDCHYLFKWRFFGTLIVTTCLDDAALWRPPQQIMQDISQSYCAGFSKKYDFYKKLLQVFIHIMSIYVYFNGLHMKWITYLSIIFLKNYKDYITKVSNFLIITLLRF